MLRILTLTAITLGILPAHVVAADPVDFRRDVRPILAEHCFHCHGPDESTRKGKLRLDTRNGATAPARSGESAIVAGKPDKSELITRITAGDESTVMPPPKLKKPLSAKQIATLRTWIEQGAAYDAGHWVFLPPKKSPIPTLKHGPQTKNPIDAFVRKRLEKEGLKPSEPASPETLARRIALDVIGLPPNPADLNVFIVKAKTDRSNAVRELVDKLLTSPHYGEKWARHWLDVARYSDSNGYEKDLPREMWAYRDWVVSAFNRDLPYNQFLIEQLAGDLLPGATQDQLIATGFLRNSMTNEEGAIVPEQFRTEELFDRMDAIGKAALGLTLQCAQCHTHKYDPITHAEYYGLFAFMNDTYEAQSWVYTQAQIQQLTEIRNGIVQIENRLRKSRPTWSNELAIWEAKQREKSLSWTPIRATDLASTSGLNHPTQNLDGSIQTLGHPTTKGDIVITAKPKLHGITGLRIEALTHGDLPFNGPGRSKYGTWALSELEVSAKKPGGTTWEKLKLVNATADFSETEHKLEDEWAAASDAAKKRICGPVAFLIDDKEETAWRADRGPGRRNQESVAVVQFEKPLDLPDGTEIKFVLKMHHSGDGNGRLNTMLGCCRISTTTAPKPAALSVDYQAILALDTLPSQRTPARQQAIFQAWLSTRADLKSVRDEIEAIWKRYPVASTSVLHLAARDPAHHRSTQILDRGNWEQPKQVVQPHVPAVLHPLPANNATPRLRFARWAADPRSPLAARVEVNRIWQAVFGAGLVETSEDFGTRATLPEHPELLDWLAVELMESGWSHKHLIRSILTSETYQQSSRTTPSLLERDPRNQLLARGPRFRVEAEVVRDLALAAAGLLNPKLGGPTHFPPVPQSVLEYNYFKPTYWNVPTSSERYRRSLYMFRKRSMPDPLLSGFDAPSSDFSCARRVRSNTPLAALTALNEPIFVEAARGMAVRTLKEAGLTDTQRADYAFRLCTGRHAKPEEIKELLALLDSQRERIGDGWLNPRTITTSNADQLPPLPTGITPRDLAAWTIVARVLLNLDETLTKN